MNASSYALDMCMLTITPPMWFSDYKGSAVGYIFTVVQMSYQHLFVSYFDLLLKQHKTKFYKNFPEMFLNKCYLL